MLPGSGIFDMRWAPHTTLPILALALADGNVQLVQQQSHGWHPVAATDIRQGMVVTVDWSRHGAREGRAAVSTSTGHLAIMQVTEQRCAPTPVPALSIQVLALSNTVPCTTHALQVGEGALRTVSCWQGHDLEAWTAAADCWQVSFMSHVLHDDPAQILSTAMVFVHYAAGHDLLGVRRLYPQGLGRTAAARSAHLR